MSLGAVVAFLLVFFNGESSAIGKVQEVFNGKSEQVVDHDSAFHYPMRSLAFYLHRVFFRHS